MKGEGDSFFFFLAVRVRMECAFLVSHSKSSFFFLLSRILWREFKKIVQIASAKKKKERIMLIKNEILNDNVILLC